jgi:hypothetical protein
VDAAGIGASELEGGTSVMPGIYEASILISACGLDPPSIAPCGVGVPRTDITKSIKLAIREALFP